MFIVVIRNVCGRMLARRAYIGASMERTIVVPIIIIAHKAERESILHAYKRRAVVCVWGEMKVNDEIIIVVKLCNYQHPEMASVRWLAAGTICDFWFVPFTWHSPSMALPCRHRHHLPYGAQRPIHTRLQDISFVPRTSLPSTTKYTLDITDVYRIRSLCAVLCVYTKSLFYSVLTAQWVGAINGMGHWLRRYCKRHITHTLLSGDFAEKRIFY